MYLGIDVMLLLQGDTAIFRLEFCVCIKYLDFDVILLCRVTPQYFILNFVFVFNIFILMLCSYAG